MKLPTQTYFCKEAILADAVVHQVWELLVNIYGLIITRPGVGSFVVSTIPSDVRKRMLAIVKRIIEGAPNIVFDRYRMTNTSKLFNSRVNRVFDEAYAFPEFIDEKALEMKLSATVEERVKSTTGYKFRDDELYFAQDYSALITSICKSFMVNKTTFVSYKPATTLVKDIFERLQKRVICVGLHPDVDPMAELEVYCKSAKVGILYIDLSPFYPGGIDINAIDWDTLLLLQANYPFVIVLDDRFPSELPVLFPENVTKLIGNNQLIYLRPLTPIHQRLRNFELMVLSSHIKLKLKKSTVARTNRLSPVTANAVLTLIKDGTLHKEEAEAYKRITEFLNKAKEEFIACKLWKAEHLDHPKGWFIYLMPAVGTLAPDTYKRLKKMNLHVIQSVTYKADLAVTKGIWISVADYKSIATMLTDIRYLNEILEKMIIRFESRGASRVDHLMNMICPMFNF